MTQASTATTTQCRDINETSRNHCEWDVTYDMAAIKFSEQIIVKVVRKDQPTALHIARLCRVRGGVTS